MSDVTYSDTPRATAGSPSSANSPDISDRRPLQANPLSGDIAAALPAPVRKKFKRLRTEADRARHAARDVSETRIAMMGSIGRVKEEIGAMTSRIGEISRLGFEGRGLSEDSGEVRAARLQLSSMQEDLAELNAKYSDPNNGVTSRLVEGLEDYIRRRRLFSLVTRPEPTLRKNETLAAAIDARRRRGNELRADLEQIERAPWPSAMTKTRAREQFAELAKRGRPDVFALVERFENIVLPTLPKLDALAPTLIDSAALIAWALGPALVAAVDREIDELSDDTHALTADQRKHRTAEVRAEILATERDEEALIEQAEAQGLPVLRRADADPRAVLAVE